MCGDIDYPRRGATRAGKKACHGEVILVGE